MDIEGNLRKYLDAREPTDRYVSFDYCFNYFQSRRDLDELSRITTGRDLELSCLHLGFYLASGGMLRGSSVLLRRSVKQYGPVVEVIAAAKPEIWEIDAHRYTAETIAALADLVTQLRIALPKGASDILVTKIMLGVFGSVPAFDTYFKKGFGVWTFGTKALQRVGEFYRDNADVIEHHRVQTIDFETGKETQRRYTRAKVIDMIFFVEGAN
jgi:hypothetical protein